MVHKQFFQQATKGEIKAKHLVDVFGNETISQRVLAIANLSPDEYTIIPVPDNYESGRKFKTHGDEVKLKRYRTVEDAIVEAKTPVQLRRQKFNGLYSHKYCSYSFIPLVGNDARKRKVPLVECLEGARLYAYMHQVPGTFARVKAYSDAKRVEIEGAEVAFEVPSRREEIRRYQGKLVSVPIIDAPEKFAIAPSIGSDHSCAAKRFSIRYMYIDDKETSKVFNFCSHEIAAYLKLIEQEKQEGNFIPLEMCEFAIPSQKTVDYYLKILNNTLIRDENIKAKDKLRKPNKADIELMLWAWVKELRHDKTFYSDRARDGRVKEYNWGAGRE